MINDQSSVARDSNCFVAAVKRLVHFAAKNHCLHIDKVDRLVFFDFVIATVVVLDSRSVL